MEEQLLDESEIKLEEIEIIDNFQEHSDSDRSPKNDKKEQKPLLRKIPPKSRKIGETWDEYLELEGALQSYYCPKCPFETKWKCYLKNHIKKIHAPAEEAPIYKCVQCGFKTKWKLSLSNHMKVHSPPHTLKMHKCPKCDYQTKWNTGLTSHMKVHMLPKMMKIILYKCKECDYESKNKIGLIEHSRVSHSDVPTLYKCPLCPFQTKFRHGVNKHLKVHNAKPK